MPVKLLGSVSGFTLIQAASAASNNTLTLPSTGSNLLSDATLPITTPTNGQIPIGNGSAYVPATITPGTGISVTNGSGTITIANTVSSGFANTVLVTATGNWTVPTGITTAKVTVVAAGGAGGGANTSTGSTRGGGGRSGGVAIKYVTGLTPGSTVACTIGAGGTGVSNGAGNSGGTTSFGAYCSATGGGGGSANINIQTYTASASGGSGSSGDVNITGLITEDTPIGVGLTTSCGGVITGSYLFYGGMRGAHGWNALGIGGALRTTLGAGNNATGYNAGGSGAYSTGTNTAGGAGAPGLIIIEY